MNLCLSQIHYIDAPIPKWCYLGSGPWEVIDLAEYTTLIVDVTSDSQLDIKLVDPNAPTNQYNQMDPFHNGYTAQDSPITEPVQIDLTQFADYDLYQINFMACGNSAELTIKSITFVK